MEIKFQFYKRLRYGADPALPGTTTTKKKGEMKILLQCFIICSVFQIEWVTFNYLPRLPSLLPFLETYVNTISSCMMVCMNTVHSIVIFTFTTRARVLLISIFKPTRLNVLPSSTVFVVHNKLSVSPILPTLPAMMQRRRTEP